jgi:DNA-binding transcriptional regulator YbjK
VWPDGLVELLEPWIGRLAAEAVALDGATLQALITGAPPDAKALANAISRPARQ